jgi:hypothetical protein
MGLVTQLYYFNQFRFVTEDLFVIYAVLTKLFNTAEVNFSSLRSDKV